MDVQNVRNVRNVRFAPVETAPALIERRLSDTMLTGRQTIRITLGE